jgi:fucose 4-O-acetylase-like acetyltransferase
LDDTKGFVKKRIKGVWWPFVKWQLIFLLLHNVFLALNIYNGEYGFRGAVSHEYGLMETLKNALFIVTTMSHGEQLLGGFWFLKSLFVGSMFFFFLTKIGLYIYRERGGEKTTVDILTGLLLFISTLVFGLIGKDIPIVGIGTKDFMAGFFIWCGYVPKT